MASNVTSNSLIPTQDSSGLANSNKRRGSFNEDCPQEKKAKLYTLRHLTLKKIYIEQIREGSKLYEVRPRTNRIEKIQVNDVVRFYYYSNSSDDVRCKVIARLHFDSYREMLEYCGFANCIPTSQSLEEALAIYHSIPNYQQRALESGVVAFVLEVFTE